MSNQMLSIQQAIDKYSGGDQAYANKLKTGIAGAMGYSNYMSQLNRNISGPADIGNVSGLSPAGINARISSRFGVQNDTTNTLQNITGSIDTAAGTLASEQAAREKAAAKAASDKARFDSSFVFHPQDELDQKILDYSKNPTNADGTIKTVQQFQQELQNEYAKQSQQAKTPGTLNQQFVTAGQPLPEVPQPKYSADDINARLTDKLPADYSGKEEYYKYRFQGFTDKDATKEQIIDYGNMIVSGNGGNVPPELYPLAYATLSPTEKAIAQGFKSGRSLGF